MTAVTVNVVVRRQLGPRQRRFRWSAPQFLPVEFYVSNQDSAMEEIRVCCEGLWVWRRSSAVHSPSPPSGSPAETNWTSHEAVPYFSAFQTGLSSTLVTVHSWSVLGCRYALCFKFSWWQRSNWVEWNHLTISETEMNVATENTSSCSSVWRSQPLALRSTQRQVWRLPSHRAFRV